MFRPFKPISVRAIECLDGMFSDHAHALLVAMYAVYLQVDTARIDLSKMAAALRVMLLMSLSLQVLRPSLSVCLCSVCACMCVLDVTDTGRVDCGLQSAQVSSGYSLSDHTAKCVEGAPGRMASCLQFRVPYVGSD